MEQYYYYCRARLLGKFEIAASILAEQDPARIKSLSRPLNSIPNRQKWEEKAVSLVYDGLLAKFSQNTLLAQFLAQTGDNTLAEASKYDEYWGTGVSMDDKSAFDKAAWTGANKMGELLEQVRRTLAAANSNSG